MIHTSYHHGYEIFKGTILGYMTQTIIMNPEQINGKLVNHRTGIYVSYYDDMRSMIVIKMFPVYRI